MKINHDLLSRWAVVAVLGVIAYELHVISNSMVYSSLSASEIMTGSPSILADIAYHLHGI